MRGTVPKALIALTAVLSLALIVAGIFAFGGTPTPVQAEELAAPPAQQPDNTQCTDCHSAPNRVMTFPNGETASITVDPEVYAQGVHANLACQVCHTNIAGFPHPERTADSAREYTLQYKDTCAQCHTEQMEEVEGSAHHALALAGNPDTPSCADCHDPHATEPIAKDENGEPAPSENQKIANICAKCHSAVVEQYKTSVHGQGVFVENNPDVPACHDCHGTHEIASTRTQEYRLNSPDLCAECHTRDDIMGKYGISTDVMDTYVSDFHGTTVVLFQRTSPDLPTNKPVCYDCHGIHNIMATDDPEKGLQVQANMLATCQKCHPDASENFSASWMSHYIASPTRFPLVFYVEWFYRLFIPGVLGGMAIFVLTDILRKAGITRQRQRDEAAKGK